MFLTAGTILQNPRVGLLFIDFEDPMRLRLHGHASVRVDDELIGEYAGAMYIVRVAVENLFFNCPRYIHKYKKIETSKNVPRVDCPRPAAAALVHSSSGS